MDEPKKQKEGIRDAVVRICPACGVVNPSGPSRECPHLQLIRFDGIDGGLEELLDQVALARRSYGELIGRLKEEALAAAREGIAEVETTRKVMSGELDSLSASQPGGGLKLTPPAKRKDDTSDRKAAKRRRRGPQPVDPRQLDLLAMSPPKGDA